MFAPLVPAFVFATRDGRPIHPRNAAKEFQAVVELANVPRIGPHGLRHSHASLLLARGVPIEVVSKRLGHASAAFTLDTYRTVFEAECREAALSLAGQVAPAVYPFGLAFGLVAGKRGCCRGASSATSCRVPDRPIVETLSNLNSRAANHGNSQPPRACMP